jgi:5-methylcytosine-specific restriction endonuclease McrA
MGRRRTLSPCNEPGCPELVPHGQRRCAKHKQEFNAARGLKAGARSARDNTSQVRFSRAVKKRDRQCVRCGSSDDLRAHHLVPVHKGGSDDPANGVTLCGRCDRAVDRYAS